MRTSFGISDCRIIRKYMSINFNKYEFVCYIDEAGCEGFKFSKGSSEWFILAALISSRSAQKQIVELIDKVKTALDWPSQKQLHWNKLRHLEKNYYVSEIIKLPCKVVVVAVYKPVLIEREKFQDRYRLYFYTVRYLLERISWQIRDLSSEKTKGTGEVGIVFSNRAGMSYEELKVYLGRLKNMSEYGQDIRIVWDYIDTNGVYAYPPGKLKGLQVADAIAGAFYNGLEMTKTKKQKSEYAQGLKPVIYKHKGVFWGNGLKIVPREAVAVLKNQSSYGWLDIFK